MEQWAGARLLHRTTRKLSLTDAGRQLWNAAGKRWRWRGDRPGGGRAERRVARPAAHHLFAIARQTALVGAVAQYLKRHPQVAVDLQMNNRAVNLVEERIDLALRITNELDPNLIARPLSTCASVVCAAPAYLAAHGTPRRRRIWRCTTADLLLFRQKPVALRCSGREIGGGGQRQPECQRVGGADGRHGAGGGISMQPYYSAAPLLASGELVELLPDYRPQSMGIGICLTPPDARHLAHHAGLLVEWFATDPVAGDAALMLRQYSHAAFSA
ncbi:LysR family transcriptional regulator [Serratia ureilytica]